MDGNGKLSSAEIVDIKNKINDAKAQLAETMKDAPARTIGSMMGEIVWLMTQSPVHRQLSVGELEWLLMPPIVLQQYKLFRDEKGVPAGAALWAYLSDEAEQKLKAGERLVPQDWANNAQLSEEKGLVAQEGGTLWLMELIAPFHTDENKQREQMLGDLITSVFEGKKFKMIHFNPKSGIREEIILNQ